MRAFPLAALLALGCTAPSPPPPASPVVSIDRPVSVLDPPGAPPPSAPPLRPAPALASDDGCASGPAAPRSLLDESGGREPPSPLLARIDPLIIKHPIRQRLPCMRRCYERGLASDPTLAGRVVVKMVIDRRGVVESASDSGSDLPDPRVVACVVDQFKLLRFPSNERGEITVVYPLIFRPGP